MLVGVMGIGLLALVVAIQALETRTLVKRFAVILIGIVLAQAVLGWATVTFFAHWQTSIPHAALGQTFFALMACLTAMLSKPWIEGPAPRPQTDAIPLHKLTRSLVIAMFVQLILGAAIRHDDHGKAILAGRFAVYYWHLGAHVAGAVAVSYFLARVLMRIFSTHRIPQFMRGAYTLMGMLTVQLILGGLAAVLKFVYSQDWLDADMPPPARAWVATAHVAVGALMFAISAVLWVRSYRFVDPLGTAAVAEAAKPNGTGVAELTA
jgi:heme A synthase